MGFLQTIRHPLAAFTAGRERRSEQRAWQQFFNATLSDREFWSEILGQLKTSSGITVTPMKALGAATVFACVNVISRSLASVPLKLYRRLPNEGREVASDHPLYPLLHDSPNEESTSAAFRRAVQGNATLRNAGYALIVRDGFGRVAEIRPVPNADIKPGRDAAGRLVYQLQPHKSDGRAVGGAETMGADRVIHVRGLTLDGICALDPTGTVRECIGLALALQDNAGRFFANGSKISNAFETPNLLKPDQEKQLLEKIQASQTGENAFRVMLLHGGLKMAQTRATNKDAEMIDAVRAQDKAICRVFGVQPHKVGILDEAHFTNVEQQGIDYVVDTILPWAVEWEQELNRKLLTPAERRTHYFQFVLDGLQRGDIKTRYEAHSNAITNGWMTRNEARAKENLNPLPGLDQPLVPLNMAQVDEDGSIVPPVSATAPRGEPTPTNRLNTAEVAALNGHEN